MEKSELRRIHLQRRLTINENDAIKNSTEISKKLINLPCFNDAENVMVYLSAKGEVLTDFIIKKSLLDGKKLYAPVCRSNSQMDAVHFSSASELTIGKYGILAPSGNEVLPPKELDLIIVPASVFGRNKHRIGYGKGYYDRFLTKVSKSCITVGLCYEINLEENVPFGEFDKPIDIIITENEVII